MLNASVGFQRVLGRLRRPPSQRPSGVTTIRLQSHAAVHQVRHGLHSIVAATRLFPVRERGATTGFKTTGFKTHTARRTLLGRLGPDRAVGLALAGILIGASVVSVSAARPPANTGGPTGDGRASRIVIGGGVATGAALDDGSDQTGSIQYGQPDPTSDDRESNLAFINLGADQIEPTAPVAVEGPFIDDGTLVKPIAVDTTVADGSDLVKTYTVQSGDTLVGIAAKYGVSMMTVWWANDLKSKDDLRVGEELRIPPVTGLIVQVSAQDTLASLAARYDVTGTDVLATNGLTDPNLVIGQVLVIPGAKGQAIPVIPKPVSKPAVRSTGGSSGGSTVRGPSTYTGGRFIWPVVGGGNYISQYFHYGHYAIDIAADYGSTVRAAGAGTVTFAGWKNNGGGYQVWIAHGSNLYTTYNHMSAITVGTGQQVAQGQQVGRIGQSGNATGPHCHFEVWIGPVWDGGRRVNPLAYL